MKPRWLARLAPALVALTLAARGAAAQAPDDRGFDPTGVWYGHHGPLALVRAGDTLSFSYSAVFGATAHTCDGIGVAGFAGDGKWEWVDEQGTVTFTTKGRKVTVTTTSGIASFCGAGWPGDSFVEEGWKPAFWCEVTRPKARFLSVGPLPPKERRAYVVKGDAVEGLELVNEGGETWILARYAGKSRTTAGLLPRDALECRFE